MIKNQIVNQKIKNLFQVYSHKQNLNFLNKQIIKVCLVNNRLNKAHLANQLITNPH